jgi:hypothetical protein
MFFGRTEKSGNKNERNCRTENGKEIKNIKFIFLINSKNDPLFFGHF